jgi:NAD(P)-dependent dehydrogenase (short-subunit alcohol dehydrogenase family)
MGILDGKVALITGAGQGVGRGIAFAMAKEGSAIAVAGRTAAKIDDTCAEILSFGGRAVPILCDVKVASDVTRTVEATVAAFGGIDILVNNAQEVPLGRLLEARIEDYQTGFDSGPIASLRFMQACYPHLKARGGGSIVNLVTAAAVRWDMAGYGMHGSVKQAIRSLTRAAAAEWGPDNIRTNNIAPEALSPGFAGWDGGRPGRHRGLHRHHPDGQGRRLRDGYRPRRRRFVRAGDGLYFRRDHPCRWRAGEFRLGGS